MARNGGSAGIPTAAIGLAIFAVIVLYLLLGR